jgi:DNA polymerase elongation subunit (family B)
MVYISIYQYIMESITFQIIEWDQYHDGPNNTTKTHNNKAGNMLDENSDSNNSNSYSVSDSVYDSDSDNSTDDLDRELDNNDGKPKYEDLEYKIRLYGRTQDGKSIHVRVDNYTPFFYVEIPKEWTQIKAMTLINYIKSKINKEYVSKGLKGFDIVERKKFYGFTGYQNFKFIRLIFKNMMSYKAFERWIEYNKIFSPSIFKTPTKLQLYESNIEPFIRCMHIRKLNACGWVKINKYKKLDKITFCDIDVSVDWKELHPHENNTIQKFVVASFDLECMSESGNFPQATNEKDPIIQIGTVFSYYGESEPFYKHMITLGGCEKISALKDVDIESYKTERNVLLAWTRLIQKMNPDVITGYNINGFDFEYMYLRAKKIEEMTKIPLVDSFLKLSKLIGETSPYKIKELSSAGLGDNLLKYIIMGGRIIIDLMKVAQRDFKLDSYKLDNVAASFIKESIKSRIVDEDKKTTVLGTTSTYGIKEDQYVNIMFNDGLTDNKHDEKYKILEINEKEKKITIDGIIPDEIFEAPNKVFWCHGKDDVSAKEMFKMFKGTDHDRAIIAKYCIQDCVLVTKLMEKLQVLNNNIAMANVCSVPLSYIFMRGQGVKIFSLVAKKCRDMEHLIPKLANKNNNNNNTNNTNNKDVPGLDSVYHKIKKANAEDEKEESEDEEKVGYEGATVFPPVKGVHYEPIPVLDYASLYPRSMIYRNISHECIVLDSKYDNLPDYDYQTVTFKNNDGTSTTCRYAKKKDGTRGILCLILIELLDKRSATKKLMEAASDKFIKNIYDGLQLAYKVTANGLYGLLGAATSPIFMMQLAASTTATGREMLEYSRDFIEGPFGELVNLAIHDEPQYRIEAEKLYTCQNEKLKTTYPSVYLTSPDNKFKEPRAGRQTMGDFIDYFYQVVNTVLNKNYGVKPQIIYGDSVTGDTPILLMNDKNEIFIKTIDTIGEKWLKYEQFKLDDIKLTNKEHDENIKYKVWTDKGWSEIKRVIRHKTYKKIYEVLTHTGCVRVTEDHSLLEPSGKQIKPIDCKIGTSLLHSFPKIINKVENSLSLDKAYIYGFFFGDGSCGKYGEKSKVKYTWALNNKDIEINYKLIEKLKNAYPLSNFKMLDTINSSGVYKIVPCCGNIKQFVEEYRSIFYDKDKHKIIPQCILNGSYNEKDEFLKGYYAADGCRKDTEKCNCHRFDTKSQISAMNLYYLVKSLDYDASINKRKDKPEIFRITYSKNKFRKDPIKIKKINDLGYIDDYVYDLETDVGHFQAGVGSMIVKNTDSVFFTMKIHDKKTLDIKTDKEALAMCIELGQLAGATICKILPDPEEQVYEKTLWPLVLISKKRYVGNLYETDVNKYYQKSMGIVLKRRDNAKIVKIVVGGIVNYILNERSNQGAIDYTRALIKKILRGHFNIDKFIITKTLRGEYKGTKMTTSENKDKQIEKAGTKGSWKWHDVICPLAHVTLCQRIKKRDPGNSPESNDRIPYVYIIPKGKVLLQGERIEDPKYVLENKLELDYLFYITNQILKPSIQFLELIAHNPEKLFTNYINKEINRRKNISSIYDYVIEENNESGNQINDNFNNKVDNKVNNKVNNELDDDSNLIVINKRKKTHNILNLEQELEKELEQHSNNNNNNNKSKFNKTKTAEELDIELDEKFTFNPIPKSELKPEKIVRKPKKKIEPKPVKKSSGKPSLTIEL